MRFSEANRLVPERLDSGSLMKNSGSGIGLFDETKPGEIMEMIIRSYEHSEREELWEKMNDEDDSDEGSEVHEKNNTLISASYKEGHASQLQQKSETEPKSYLDYLDDEDESDVLQKHQLLIKQMRSEIKNSRVGGLSTISEESEIVAESYTSPELDKKVEYKDVMKQIHLFYKTYSEKMKRLDILNYQTLQAISLHKMYCEQKSSAKSYRKTEFCLPKSWWRFNIRKVHHDPVQTPINKLDHDLELVYIGQLCLSWEILNWLSEKSQELIDYDPLEKRSYNQAAERFQMFQVMLQRFMEDEEFHGDRIHHYVTRRNMIGSLLHVPKIEDDGSKSKREQGYSEDRISIKGLHRIIINSKAIFRDFIISDKKSENLHSKKLTQDAKKSELLMDIMTALHKKEREVKEYMKFDSCNVKQMKKFVEDEVLRCEVELKLVGRVLRVSGLTTDQLLWCLRKVENIRFIAAPEHNLSLFPC